MGERNGGIDVREREGTRKWNEKEHHVRGERVRCKEVQEERGKAEAGTRS